MSNSYSAHSDLNTIISNLWWVLLVICSLFFDSPWIPFVLYLFLSCSCASSDLFDNLPQIKQHPTFCGVSKSDILLDSFSYGVFVECFIFPCLLSYIDIDKLIACFLYILAGGILGVLLKRVLIYIFYYFIVLPSAILIYLADSVADYFSAHKTFKRFCLILIAITGCAFVFMWFLFPKPRTSSIQVADSSSQSYNDPRPSEVVSPQSDIVWIPTHGGKKYHRRSTCSGMEDPEQTTKEDAIARGFDACQRCY